MAATTNRRTTTAKKTAATVKATAEAKKSEPSASAENGSKAENTKEQELLSLVKDQAELIKNLQAQIEGLKEKTSYSTAQESNEKVVFLWQAPVADDNIMEFGADGRYGRIVGKVGNFMIPKNELSQIMDSRVRYFMDQRWLIVLSGLTDDERAMFGVNYKPGEYLSKEAFLGIADLDEKLLDVYPALCEPHKEIVAKFLYEAWLEGKDLKRDTIIALNRIAKNDAFKQIIEEMNEKDVE